MPECLVSWAVNEPFYVATRDVLEWNLPADGDANYRTVPIVRLEGPLQVCKVEWPPGARPDFGGIMEKTLHLFDFIEPAYTQLIAAGWLQDSAGNDISFPSREEVNEKAWALITANPDDPAWIAEPDSFDDLDPLGALPAIAWVNVDIGLLVEKERTLAVYVDLSRILYKRDGAAQRANPNHMLHITTNHFNGLLLHAVASFHVPGFTVLPHVAYLAARLSDFLIATRWPTEFYFEHNSLDTYAYELASRANTLQATRAQWNAMLRPRALQLGRIRAVFGVPRIPALRRGVGPPEDDPLYMSRGPRPPTEPCSGGHSRMKSPDLQYSAKSKEDRVGRSRWDLVGRCPYSNAASQTARAPHLPRCEDHCLSLPPPPLSAGG